MATGDNNNGALLEIRGLSAALPNGSSDAPVLERIDLTLQAGEFAAIIGPSGCGKSTLFNVLAGLIGRYDGEMLLNGSRVLNLKGAVAYMQQKDLLLPWRSALDNAVLGLEIQGASKNDARRKARELFGEFGLAGCEDRAPSELSGGMRQRVALLRTVLCKKDVLLMDEPFGALDAITRRAMQRWLLDVCARYNSAVLFVTHDVEEALILSDKVYVLSHRPASIKNMVRVESEKPRSLTDPELIGLRERLLSALEDETIPV